MGKCDSYTRMLQLNPPFVLKRECLAQQHIAARTSTVLPFITS